MNNGHVHKPEIRLTTDDIRLLASRLAIHGSGKMFSPELRADMRLAASLLRRQAEFAELLARDGASVVVELTPFEKTSGGGQ